MILEIRKSCLETIERALSNLQIVNSLCEKNNPKKIQHKIQAVRNEVELLKDNFTIIVAKILHLQGRCSEKENHAHQTQTKFRSKFQDIQEKYKILELRHQKTLKQLNFIKFSNNNLRKQLTNLEIKERKYEKLKTTLKNIELLIAQNAESLQSKVHCAVSEAISSHDLHLELERVNLNPESEIKIENIKKTKTHNSSQKHEIRRSIFSSFKAEKDEKDKGPEIYLQPNSKKVLNLKGEKEREGNEEKRSELAKLIEQQSRLAKIKERYLSTDIL